MGSSYAVPDRIAGELDKIRNNGLICLIGSQGVGKSSALMGEIRRYFDA